MNLSKNMNSELLEEVFFWSVIHSKVVTLVELETNYSYDDYLKLCAYIAYNNDVETKIEKTINSSQKKV